MLDRDTEYTSDKGKTEDSQEVSAVSPEVLEAYLERGELYLTPTTNSQPTLSLTRT